ncbi:uncharacterized protein LOC121923366 [Sceloporus undulatus]|uniref:uncharacterized protein LOC121923366 n=1 Tax=Sceloporus undulatus TaxID=8520 RepID=UPI001C4C01C1|nr:uncharacterized protein LOC121923366 [Sceloporus undulatus]
MSAIRPDVPKKTEGTNTEPKKDTVPSAKITSESEHEKSFRSTRFSENQGYRPGQFNSSEDLSHIPSTHLAAKIENELPASAITSTTTSPYQQGKVPLRHAYYTNGCGVAQASVRQQQPRGSKNQRIGSTTSICTNNSKKSCKSTASQIQEVAGDELCATLLLACLFCRSSDILPLLTGSFCFPSCFPLPACSSRLLSLCSDPQGCCCCCCCCCRPEGPGLELCYQTGDCLELALEVSELCYH